MNGIVEVQYVETGGRLVQPIAVSARIEAEQARDHQPQGRLVRDDQHLFALVSRHDRTKDRQRAREHRQAGLAVGRRKREGVGFPRQVLLGRAGPELGDLLSLGLTLATCVLVGFGLGWLLDLPFSTFPRFALVGLLAGVVAASVYFYKTYKKFSG